MELLNKNKEQRVKRKEKRVKSKEQRVKNIDFLNVFVLCSLFIVLGLSSPNLQADTYRVFFKDKGPETFEFGTNFFQRTLEEYSEEALIRRFRTVNYNEETYLTIEDAAVYQPYLDSLTGLGAEVLLTLRWRNYAVIEIEEEVKDQLIESIFGIKEIISTRPIYLVTQLNEDIDYYQNFIAESYDYGEANKQLELVGIDKLHAMGFNGDDIIVGVSDTGYRWKEHGIYEDLEVIGEYDFIQFDDNTFNEEGDHPNQHNHGTSVLSLMGAYSQGNLIGVNNRSKFILSKTEHLTEEEHLDEDRYVASVEWMERMGADVINTSLGYRTFDPTDSSYTYDQLDGRSTIVADVVNKAVARGVVFCTSAGNDGGRGSRTIISPADADSVLSVGAMKLDTNAIAGFSSIGPRVDGAIYPNITAPGQAVYVAPASGTHTTVRGNGTSFASPMLAGCVAQLKSAHPDLHPWEVRDIMFRASNRYDNPDSVYGYGMPDMFEAFKMAGISVSPFNSFQIKNNQLRILVYILTYLMMKNLNLVLYHTKDVEAGIDESKFN